MSSGTSKKPLVGKRNTFTPPLWISALAVVIAFFSGVCTCLLYLGHWHAKWNDALDWNTIATLIGAVVNAFVVIVVGWAITAHLQDRQAGQNTKRQILSELIHDTLLSAGRIHEYAVDCHCRKTFDENDRQQLILRFIELGQGILLIEDTFEAMGLPRTLAADAQSYRGDYKDFLTDRTLGSPFTPEDEKLSHIKHRELRQILVELMIRINTQRF